MKRRNLISRFGSFVKLALIVLLAAIAPQVGRAGTTVTLTQQTANYPNFYFTLGGNCGWYNSDATSIGMYAHTDGSKQTVGWRNFMTADNGGGSARNLQVGDVFQIRVYSSAATGQMGFSLNASGTQGTSYANNISGSRLYFVENGIVGQWSSVSSANSGNPAGFGPTVSSTSHTYQFSVRITSQTTADAFMTSDGGSAYNAYNMPMNGSAGANINAYSIFLSDDYNGSVNANIYWGTTTSVQNSGVVQLGYYLTSGTFTPGLITDGLDAASTSTSSPNAVYIGGNSGTKVILNQANTFTGGATINNGGTVQVNSTESAGTSGPLGKSGPITLPGGTLQYSSADTADYSGRFSTAASQAYNIDVNGQSVSFGNNLTSSGGSLTLSDSTGGGKLTLSGANTYSGGTTISGGNLTVASGGNLGSGSVVSVASAGSLTVNNSCSVSELHEYASGNGGTASIGSGAVLTVNGSSLGTFYMNSISGSGTLTMAGSGTSQMQLYGSPTVATININSATLGLQPGVTLGSSSSVNIAAGATFDLSQATSPYNWGSSAGLTASGTGTTVGTSAAAIKGPSSGTVSLGSRPITLTYDGSHPALYISQGTLSLSGNAFTVNGTALTSGNYTIVQQASGNITSSGSYTVTGTAIDGTHYGTIAVSSGNVVLTVALKPTVTGKTYSRAPGTAYKIYASDLAATATVTTGYTPTFDHADSTTANGASLGTSGSGNSTIIVYPGNAANAADSFSYTINDGHGGSVSGTVTITINTGVTGQASINLAGQTASVGFFGVSGDHYVVQRSVNDFNSWADLTDVTTSDVAPSGISVDGNGVITAPSSGAFSVTDPSPPVSPTSVYYRLRAAP